MTGRDWFKKVLVLSLNPEGDRGYDGFMQVLLVGWG